ncbi:MAG: hypothetical protein BKP49_10210 [Treponema sp. CETP13]|nr:MAG: hypothetical protein BKP49_10210 [Treponema sp. CETP13]
MIEVFKWDQSFNTEISFIDEQHKSLVNELNKAINICLSEKKIEKNDLDELGKNLEDYIHTHLTAEEDLMQKYKLDERYVKKHEIEHNEFRKKCETFFGSISDTEINKAKIQKFIEYLISWLTYHILNIDKKLGRQIVLVKGGMPPEMAYIEDSKKTDRNSELLLKALQSLFTIVNGKNLELEKVNKTLEFKVKERTAELEAVNKKLKVMSMNDELTGLPNRRQALIIIEQCIKTWERYGTPFSVLFIDADRFKSVNDNFGHEAGDEVLKWISDFLCANYRNTDIVCRLGGDEFLVICTESNIDSSLKAAESFITKARAIRKNNPHKYWDISFSVGVSGISKEIHTPFDILKSADDAMYIIKHQGGNGLSKK